MGKNIYFVNYKKMGQKWALTEWELRQKKIETWDLGKGWKLWSLDSADRVLGDLAAQTAEILEPKDNE